jgi:anaerobic C4-dicarboxylate transporter
MNGKINKGITILLSIWIMLIFIGIAGVSFINIKVSKVYEDSTYYKKVLNAPLRSYRMTPITEDSLYLKRREREIKNLLK